MKITVEPQSVQPKCAWLITAEHDSFGRLGHRQTLASTGLLAPVALGLHFGRRGRLHLTVSVLPVSSLLLFTASFTNQTAFTDCWVSTLIVPAASSAPVASVFNLLEPAFYI